MAHIISIGSKDATTYNVVIQLENDELMDLKINKTIMNVKFSAADVEIIMDVAADRLFEFHLYTDEIQQINDVPQAAEPQGQHSPRQTVELPTTSKAEHNAKGQGHSKTD